MGCHVIQFSLRNWLLKDYLSLAVQNNILSPLFYHPICASMWVSVALLHHHLYVILFLFWSFDMAGDSPCSQTTSNLWWNQWRWDSIRARRRELLPFHSYTHTLTQPTSSPPHCPLPPARPLGLSFDVTLSQPLSLKAASTWQFWPHRLSLFAVTGHAPASHYANSHS